MDNSNIVDLSVKMTLVPRKKEYTGCRCVSVYAIEEFRNLECQDCKRTIDPFDYLWKLANGQQKIVRMASNLKREIKDLQIKLDALKKEERNAKSRVKRLRGK